jgi:spermidine/putrescine ABC transporter ATP-binding subunit
MSATWREPQPQQPQQPQQPAATSAEPPARTLAVELCGVSKSYRGHRALEPVDLRIEDGEFFCLLGPSGCGKTTMLNLVGGFTEATTGEIRVGGEPVNDVPPHKRNVNTVFQSYALFPHLSVRGNVGFGLKMARVERRESAGRVDEALALVGLSEYADRYPSQLSGGQQQRVAVARALVKRPAVLLLDEPFGALDLKLRKRLQVELAQIHRDVGTTFLFVTHDQEEAMTMADRIAVMNAGRIEQIGSPQEVYRRPSSRFVADFIGDSNFFDVERRDGRVVTRDGVEVPAPAGDWKRAVLMVRPECVRLDEDGTGAGLDGRVLKRSFLGSFTRVALECPAADEPIVVALHGRQRDELADEDGAARLTWSPGDAVVLDAQ